MTLQELRAAAKGVFPGRALSVSATAWYHREDREYTEFSLCVHGVSSEKHNCVAVQARDPHNLITLMREQHGDKLGIEKTDVPFDVSEEGT